MIIQLNQKKRHQQQCPIGSNNSSKVTCQIYRKPNHLAINYWYRFDYSYQFEDFPQALLLLQ